MLGFETDSKWSVRNKQLVMSTEDLENWKVEGEAVINDIKNHVKEVCISKTLECNNRRIYLNLTTLEDKQYCVELSVNGFRIVGSNYDTKNNAEDTYFETPYSLLNTISPEFSSSFGNALFSKLSSLNGNA